MISITRTAWLLATTCLLAPALWAKPSKELPEGEGPWPVLLHYQEKADVLAIKTQHDFWKIDEKAKTVLMQVNDINEYQLLMSEGFGMEIEPELMRLHNRLKDLTFDEIRTINGFACYRTVAETYQAMTDMQNNHPTLVELVDIGDSWHKSEPGGDAGHDLQVVKITNQAITTNDKPVLYAMGSIHSREYPPAELVTRFAEYLLAQYGQNADVTWLIDHHEIHLLLIGNPDGRAISENESFANQRKNRNENHCFQGNQQGVDMNRNFEFMWNQGTGSSSDSCSQVYRGTAHLSEPETEAIDNYISTLFTDDRPNDLVTPAPLTKMGVYLDIHNVAELTLFPWGFDNGIGQAPNHDQLQTLARRMSFFTGYRPEQSNASLGGADGASDDNAYGKLGVAAFTIELGEGGFYSSCSAFDNRIWPDNLPAMIYAAKASRQPYIDASGPTVENLPSAPVEVAMNGTFSVQGLATDLNFYQNNGTEATHNITSVQAYVGTPPWAGGASAVSMAPQDGQFNAKSENFTGQLSASGLTGGKHLVWVTATDADGITGVPSAFFIDVIDSQLIGTLSGTVTDDSNGSPVAQAMVSFDGIQTSTDQQGQFSIQATARTADLEVSQTGYQPQTINSVTITAQQTATQNVALVPVCGDEVSTDVNGFANIAAAKQNGWATAADQGSDDWRVESNSGVGGSAAFVTSDADETTDKYLISPEIVLDSNGVLRFWHQHDFESSSGQNYDGGILEISADGGQSWQDLGNQITQNGYNGQLNGQYQQPLGAAQAFVGTINAFQEVVVDLSSFNNQTIQFRWRLGADQSVSGGDWQIDDISVENHRACAVNNDVIFIDGFEGP